MSAAGNRPPDRASGDGALESLVAAFPEEPNDPGTWPLAEELLPQALAAVEQAQPGSVAAATLLNRAATFELARGQLERSLELAERGVEGASEIGDLRTRGDSHYALAQVLTHFDRDEDVREHLEEALQMHEDSLEPADPAVRRDRIALGDVLLELGDLAAGRDAIERAVAAGRDHPDDETGCVALAALGWSKYTRGLYGAALAAYVAAIARLESLRGPEHFELINMRICLGLMLLELGEVTRAHTEFEAALDHAERALGTTHPEADVARSMLASALYQQREYGAALEQLEAALDNGNLTLPSGSEALWIRHRKLADTLIAAGDLERAMPHVEAAISLSEKSESTDAVRLLRDHTLQAGVLHRLGRAGEAREAYRRARSLLERIPASDLMSVASGNISIARTAQTFDDLLARRRHLEAALEAYRKVEGLLLAETHATLATVELTEVSAQIAEELAASYKALGQSGSSRGVLDRGREAFVDALDEITARSDDAGAIAVAEAARDSAPQLAFEALGRAESIVEQGEPPSGLPWGQARLGAAWHRLGRSCRAHDETERAQTAFEAAVELLGDDPQLLGVALHDLADVHAELGRRAEAIALLKEAAERKRESGRNPSDRVTTLVTLARALVAEGSLEAAEAVYREAQEVLEALPDPNPQIESLLLYDLGEVRLSQEKLDEAARFYRDAAKLAREAAKSHREAADHHREASSRLQLANTLIALGRALFGIGKLDEALAAYEERMQILAGLPDRDPQAEGVTLHDIANTRRLQGDLGLAASTFREAADRKREGGQNALDLTVTLLALARALAENGEHDAALRVLEERIELLRGLPERDPVREGVTLYEIGSIQRRAGRLAEAIERYRETEVVQRESGNDEHLALTLLKLGRSLGQVGKHEEALAAFQDRLAILKKNDHGDPQEEGVTLHDIGDVFKARGEWQKASELYEEAGERKRRAVPDNPRDLATTLLALGRARLASGDPDGALAAFEQRTEVLGGLPEPDLAGEALTLQGIVDALRSVGRGEEVPAHFEEATRRLTNAGAKPGDLAKLLADEATRFLMLRDGAEVERLATSAADLLRERTDITDQTERSAALMLAAQGAEMQGKKGEAIPLLEEALRLLLDAPGTDPMDIAIMRRQLSAALKADGRAADAQSELAKAREALGEAVDKAEENGAALPILATLSADIEAPELIEEILARARGLVASNPEDPRYKRLLANTLQSVGHSRAGGAEDPQAALEAYREQLEVLEGMSERERKAEGDAHRSIGDMHRAQGDLPQALSAYRLSVECLRDSADGFTLANALRLLAEAHAAGEEWSAAQEALEDRLATLGNLPPDPRRSQFEALTLQRMATIQLQQGQVTDANQLAGEAIQRFDDPEGDRSDVLAEVLALGTETALAAGDRESAAARIKDAERAASEAPWGVRPDEDVLAKIKELSEEIARHS
jgi:tetratricopeptide (TPR) repeat protein